MTLNIFHHFLDWWSVEMHRWLYIVHIHQQLLVAMTDDIFPRLNQLTFGLKKQKIYLNEKTINFDDLWEDNLGVDHDHVVRLIQIMNDLIDHSKAFLQEQIKNIWKWKILENNRVMNWYFSKHKQSEHCEDQIWQREKNNSSTKISLTKIDVLRKEERQTSIAVSIHCSISTKFDGGFQEKSKISFARSIFVRFTDDDPLVWKIKSIDKQNIFSFT